MALQKGVNSYVSLEEAATYFEDRLDVAAWASADVTQQTQALITATAILDDQVWLGVAVSASQALAFPRSGEFLDPKLNLKVAMNPTPQRILNACFELAYHLLNNDGVLDQTDKVSSFTVGSLAFNGVKAPPAIPDLVLTRIRPLLVRGVRNWWRAN